MSEEYLLDKLASEHWLIMSQIEVAEQGTIYQWPVILSSRIRQRRQIIFAI